MLTKSRSQAIVYIRIRYKTPTEPCTRIRYNQLKGFCFRIHECIQLRKGMSRISKELLDILFLSIFECFTLFRCPFFVTSRNYRWHSGFPNKMGISTIDDDMSSWLVIAPSTSRSLRAPMRWGRGGDDLFLRSMRAPTSDSMFLRSVG